MSFEELISTIANFIVCNYDQISMKIVHDRMRMPSVDLDEIIGGIPFENEVDIVPGDSLKSDRSVGTIESEET